MSKIFALIFVLLVASNVTYSQYINDTLEVKITLDSASVPDSTKLEQKYPNPFSPPPGFYFKLHEKSLAKFNFYDKDKKLIAVIFEKELEPGYYNIDWYIAKFPSGLYYYELVTQNYEKSLKFVLIK